MLDDMERRPQKRPKRKRPSPSGCVKSGLKSTLQKDFALTLL
jgi:hypothetical protein